MATASGFVGKAFEKYFFEFSMYDKVFHKYVSSRESYVALRHVAFCSAGIMGLINFNFPFTPSFPTIGMCPSGWKGTFVCESDKGKALDMYVPACLPACLLAFVVLPAWVCLPACMPDCLPAYKAWKAGKTYEPVAHH
ncbi:hypothetical protein FOA52_010788 [Chlamydomonas sp. UWO 241]|nr:hypothetical protein FOA52_010788 [Chlamydomonas sp. UWO 241]